jgi:phage-related minor tail protein
MSDPSQTPSDNGLDDLVASASSAASSIDTAFSKAGASLAQSLAKGASDGKLSLADLARAAVSAVDALAGVGGSSTTSAAGGLGAALGQALGGALSGVFGGARADGGPVSPGGAYLVGERGPEVFQPTTSGDITPATSGGVTVNLNVQGASNPAAFARSDAQIAQALARAAGLGMR